jgi:hypothetical protein
LHCGRVHPKLLKINLIPERKGLGTGDEHCLFEIGLGSVNGRGCVIGSELGREGYLTSRGSAGDANFREARRRLAVAPLEIHA